MLHNPALDGSVADKEAAQAFEQLTPYLHRFSERHSLFVRKYLHNQPLWGFYFRHPRGGTGMLQLGIGRDHSGAMQGSLAGGWYVDDDDRQVRSTYWIPVVYLESLAEDYVVTWLKALLDAVLSAEDTMRTRSARIVERKEDSQGKYVYSDFEKALQIPT